MTVIARTRADVDVRSSLKVDASILDRFPGDCLVEVLEELNGWYKIKPMRLMHTITGYLPKPALVFPRTEKPPVFPYIAPGTGSPVITSVPGALKLVDFQKWLTIGGKPGWLRDEVWAALNAPQQSSLSIGILASLRVDQTRWDNWVAGVTNNKRLEEAVMDEWIVMVEGGCELFAIRDHYIYKQPLQNENYLGCALKGQIMRWTGNVRSSTQDTRRRNFYEVEFYRMSRYMRGWFRADLCAIYDFPDARIDPQVDANSQTVFDLSKKILRAPQDAEIVLAKSKGYTGAQYIDVFAATQKRLVHFSLCGEFCAAALGAMDVIPLLQRWLGSKYPRARAILDNPHEGTSLTDLLSMLKCLGLRGEIYSSIPTTPQNIKNRLASGQLAIAGCGINSIGKVRADGKIRHWVVIEDVLPAGNDGWVRVYNPFNNQDEVYNYTMFMRSAGVGGGLWVSRPPAQT
jgi:hypothetical protein